MAAVEADRLPEHAKVQLRDLADDAGLAEVFGLHTQLNMIETIVITGLATAGVARVITSEHGPFNLIEKFRTWIASVHPELGKVFSCPICLSVWLVFPMAVAALVVPAVLIPIAALGLAYAAIGMGALWK